MFVGGICLQDALKQRWVNCAAVHEVRQLADVRTQHYKLLIEIVKGAGDDSLDTYFASVLIFGSHLNEV